MNKISEILSNLILKLADFSQNFGNLNSGAKLNWDIFVVLFIFLAFFLYGITAGRNKLTLFFFSIYVSFLLVEIFPYWSLVEKQAAINKSYISYSIGFVILTILIFLLFSHSGIKTFFALSSIEKGSWFQIFIFSIIGVGLLTSFLLSFFSQSELEILSPRIIRFFGVDTRFGWLAASLIVMSFVHRHHRHRREGSI
ncbi:MAG: hypothetical protein HYW77_01575 [Parcubacteria group bacterium]|nr:hypothetical protein [Parcubacteria group bacterium]